SSIFMTGSRNFHNVVRNKMRNGNPSFRIFWVPGEGEFPILTEVYNRLRGPNGLRRPVANQQVKGTVDWLRKEATRKMVDRWRSRPPKERGNHFLDLYEHEKGRAIKPIHIKGGPWIRSKASANNVLFARLTRSILGHASTGEYRQRFHPHLPTNCQCGAELQTRQHLITECPLYKEEWPGMVLTFLQYVK